MTRIVLLGDSIRMSYQQGVRQRLEGRAEVIAPEANCGHSMWIRENLQDWAIGHEPDVVHFNSGIWDFGAMPGENVPRFTVAAYERNLKLIVDRLRRDTEAELVFATTTPILAPLGPETPKDQCRIPKVVDRYNNAAKRLMQSRAVAINDLNTAIVRAGVYQCLAADKIHLCDRGREVACDAVAAALEAYLAG